METSSSITPKIKYPIARQHQTIQVLPQFKPIRRGRREKAVENVYVSKDGKSKATISMFHQLDIADQDLLLCVLAISLSQKRGGVLSEESENNIELWEKLETKGIYAKWKTLCIQTTTYEILMELGKSLGKNNYIWLEKSLDRLTRTTIKLKNEEGIGHTNLLSYGINNKTQKIEIAINPISALVLMNDKKGYVFQNREERLKLKNDVARALYSVLVGLIPPKKKNIYSSDILLEKVYLCKIEEEGKDGKKNKRKAINEAFKKINKLERFEINFFKNNQVQIQRK